MNPVKELTITDIPRRLFGVAIEHLWNFTIGFLRVERNRKGQDAILLGSGVLVRANSTYAILTAAHVIDALPKVGRLGLILSTKAEQTTIDISGTEYQIIDRGEDEQAGPDIGVVCLSPSTSSVLRARKSFYNLSKHRERMLTALPEDRMGIWIANGFIEEMTITDLNPSPYELVKGFCQFGSIGGVESRTTRGTYDYYRFPIVHSTSNFIPYDFGGVSGSGLWQIILVQSEDKPMRAHEYLLQGLTFFQEPYVDNCSALHCHGPHSIYEVAYSAIARSGALS